MANDEHLGAGVERHAAAGEVTSRFRPRYRALLPNEIAHHDAIKSAATTLEKLIEAVPAGREQALAITNLELAVMWAVKSLTA